jgi:hypothetical protein
MSDQAQSARGESISPGKPSALRALRVWPAVILVVLMIVARFVPAYLEGGLAKYWMFAMMGPYGLLSAAGLSGGWRRVGRPGRSAFSVFWDSPRVRDTMALVEPLMRGPGTIYVTLPMGMTAFVAGAGLFRNRRPLARTCAGPASGRRRIRILRSARNDGMNGEYQLTLHWRWAPTAEERMLAARTTSSPAPEPNMPSIETNLALTNLEWPGFRGADRSGAGTVR